MAKREIREENRQIGQMLRDARKSKHLLQEDMAKATDISKNHLCDIECGRSKGSVRLLLGYCNRLGMTPNEILGFEEEEANVIPELRTMIKHLTPEQQERLLAMAEAAFEER